MPGDPAALAALRALYPGLTDEEFAREVAAIPDAGTAQVRPYPHRILPGSDRCHVQILLNVCPLFRRWRDREPAGSAKHELHHSRLKARQCEFVIFRMGVDLHLARERGWLEPDESGRMHPLEVRMITRMNDVREYAGQWRRRAERIAKALPKRAMGRAA